MSKINRFAQVTAATLLIFSLSIARVQTDDIFRTLQMDPSTSTFLKYANRIDLGHALESQGPFTVLVPNNEAFAKFKKANPALYKTVVTDDNLLKQLLRYHMIHAVTMSGDFKDGDKLTTLQGDHITVTMHSSGPRFNGRAKIVTSNMRTTNGVIQVIDTVLIPKEVRAEAAGR